MVIQELSSTVIFLDTAPLIYFIEGHSQYQQMLKRLFESNDQGSFLFITSTITLVEVLVKPLREGKVDIAKQYKDILTKAPGIEMVGLSPSIAERAAALRAKYNLRTPDAIQLATSIETEAHYFLTNDIHLKAVSSIKVLTLNELQ